MKRTEHSSKESGRPMGRKAIFIINKLAELYTTGEFSGSPFCLLVTALLSHRTKDKKTASAKERLFQQLPDINSIATANLHIIEELIKDVGFYRVKARRIKQIAQILKERYEGRVPGEEKELLALPGVGRKTANCVLAYGFGIPSIPVDTHVHRISNVLGLVKTKTPEQTEVELKKVVPKSLWIKLNELFVKFGKDICRAKRPLCTSCPLNKFCTKDKIV